MKFAFRTVEGEVEPGVPPGSEGDLRPAGLMYRTVAEQPGVGPETWSQPLHVGLQSGATRLLFAFEQEDQVEVAAVAELLAAELAVGDDGKPRLIGMAKALDLFWSCDSLDAEQEERIGLVNRVFDDERLIEETQAYARKLARGAPLAVRLVKKLVYQGLASDLRGALELVAANMPVVRMSEEDYNAWLDIARETSYKNFAENVPNGQAIIDAALAVD